jgi:hypothetical protein
VLVAYASNPTYSGDRDQKDHGSKLALENNSQGLISKAHHKKGLVEVEWLKV